MYIAEYAKVPVVNAMTDINHPCEILSDLYALSKLRPDFRKDSFLFCGQDGNIGRAWKEAADVFGFKLEQCCGKGYEIEGLKTYENIDDAIVGKDIVCTDSLPDKANKGALLNPCPPFYRGEEVSEDAIDSEYFVGHEFKKALLVVQQAIIVNCLAQDN